jgi:4-hydroxybenzoate polyprenyltransferase
VTGPATTPRRAPGRAPAPEPDRGRRALPALVLESMRPRQWSKNAFVLAGVIFAGRWTEPEAVLRAAAAFAAFCLLSGSSYLLNDAVDADRDRLNPRTAGRPIARGVLAKRTGLVAAALALAAGLALALAVNWETAATAAGFVALQLGYSAGLKHALFIDVMIIASGFVLRALAGIVAVEAELSPWLLLCTGLLALFLGLAKRRGEAVAMGGDSHPQRPVLDYYSVGLLDELISVVTPTTLVAYALYTLTGARSDAMLLTLPFVLYGIFRVLFLIHHRSNVTEEPEVVVWRDRPLLVCILLWGITAAVVSLVST